MLATRYGLAAIDLVHAGKFDQLVVLQGNKISSIPLAEAISKNRTVGDEYFDVVSGLQPKK
jgi:6-phosphofructokinase 1